MDKALAVLQNAIGETPFDATGSGSASDKPHDLINARAVRFFYVSLAWGLVISAVFVGKPSLDLMISNWFFDDASKSTGFTLAHNSHANRICDSLQASGRWILLISVLWMIVELARRGSRRLPAVIIACALLIGPGLVINGVLKEHWDRARPRNITDFHGTKTFTPAWVVSDQCERNCSFTSGDASAGFFPMVGFLITGRRRWLAAGIGLGLGIGLLRIMMGAHFASDVLLSGAIVGVVCALISLAAARWMPRVATTTPE